MCGAAMWLPRELECLVPARTAIRRVTRIEEALENADVVMTLRVQQERLHEPALAIDEYILQYQLTPERLRIAKPDALVMHPGPMVRGLEIDPAHSVWPHYSFFQPVSNRLPVRLHLLYPSIAT